MNNNSCGELRTYLARTDNIRGFETELSENTAAVTVPTLIMATPSDPIHPLSFAEALADAIPHASLVKQGPKQLNDRPHIEEVNSRIFQFLDSVLREALRKQSVRTQLARE